MAEARGGRPAAVKPTHRRGDAGIIRLMFPDAPNADDDSLEEIGWDEFFEKFDAAKLALVYQDSTAGGEKKLQQADRPRDRRRTAPRREPRQPPQELSPAAV